MSSMEFAAFQVGIGGTNTCLATLANECGPLGMVHPMKRRHGEVVSSDHTGYKCTFIVCAAPLAIGRPQPYISKSTGVPERRATRAALLCGNVCRNTAINDRPAAKQQSCYLLAIQ